MNLHIRSVNHAAIEAPSSILSITSHTHGKNKNMKEEGSKCPSFFVFVCYNRGTRQLFRSCVINN